MKVHELAQKLGLKIITRGENIQEKEVSGVYACDLLSHAMAKVNQGDIWITVHTNLNVIAVASLSDCACVLIPESIEIEEQTIKRAEEKGVILLSTPLTSANICYEIYKIIKEQS